MRPVTNEQGEVTLLIPEGREITERKQQERKRERIINRVTDAIVEVNSDWEFTLVNEQAEEFYDMDREYLLGRNFWDIFPEARGSRFEEEYRHVMETREPTSFTEHYSGLDGWFHVEAYPKDDGGVAFYFREVTDQIERSRELERAREFFTEAERLGDLGAWEFDATGELTWTDGTRRIHEVDDAFEPTMEEAIEFFHPEDRERIEQAVEAALEAGESYDLEARLITARGNRRWVRTRGHALSDENHTVRGYIQDITERKEREQELQNAHAKLEDAIEAGAVGTWEWHIPDDRLVVGNEFARRFGVDPDIAQEGVELDHFLSSIHRDDRERVEQHIEAAMQACGEYEEEYRIWDANDEFNWVLARGHVECDEDGTPVRFPGVLVDITERKQIERELQRKNERLNEFASVISHDLRNPLSVAEGRLQLAGEECDSEHLAAVEQAHDRMRTLTEDLLTLARQGDAVDDSESIDVTTLVESCWEHVETSDATLAISIDRPVRGDESRLKQLFENLIRNAVDHGGEGVTITVGELSDGFYVEDDGPGIPEDERGDVFDAGYSTSEEGTGLGLSIVKQIVEAHDWEIQVTESSDGGARFEIIGVEFAE